ncbi:MAG: hypothetical protein SOX57_07410 [Schaalia hyovaginalis]|uniref:hypothetical protein n=1 Tax=Schaalia hyovaginalis TaxID=29316 RepID=UPI002A80D130|nr:hypothetical protein [Schaalia hyovaginalis]MDY3666339.1 hypothetical protein [Schaalia hyovaginalis]MDY4263142.1 hypothetical protein [Schaalia hyovaginalis]
MTDERIGDLQHQELEKIIRAALRLGEAVAQQLATRMARDRAVSAEHAQRLREALTTERDAAQRLYRRALAPAFWEDPSVKVDEVTEVVKAARAFAPWDPEAALAARECERHAGIEAQAQAQRLKTVDEVEHVEAAAAQASSNGEQTPRVGAERDDATRSAAAWDSAQARADWITRKASGAPGADVHALHSVLLADTSLHAPARTSVSKPQAKKARKTAAASSRTATMRQSRRHSL